MQNKFKGYLLGIIAAVTYGMNPLFALPLYQDGMNVDSVLFFRYLFAIPIIGAMLKFRGYSFRIRNKNNHIATVCLGLLMALSSLALFKSYTFMAAGIASTLLFVYPILVALIMWGVYKEKITVITTACILTACIGIALLCNSDGGDFSWTGTLFVFISALSYAIYLVWINRPSLSKQPTLRITFYVLVYGISIFVVRLIFWENLIFPSSPWLWLCIFGLAAFPTAISFLCTTAAIQNIGSTPTAILGALEPVTALIFGISIFNEVLTARDCIGIVLIISAVAAIISGGQISKQLTRFRKMFPRIFHKR